MSGYYYDGGSRPPPLGGVADQTRGGYDQRYLRDGYPGMDTGVYGGAGATDWPDPSYSRYASGSSQPPYGASASPYGVDSSPYPTGTSGSAGYGASSGYGTGSGYPSGGAPYGQSGASILDSAYGGGQYPSGGAPSSGYGVVPTSPGYPVPTYDRTRSPSYLPPESNYPASAPSYPATATGYPATPSSYLSSGSNYPASSPSYPTSSGAYGAGGNSAAGAYPPAASHLGSAPSYGPQPSYGSAYGQQYPPSSGTSGYPPSAGYDAPSSQAYGYAQYGTGVGSGASSPSYAAYESAYSAPTSSAGATPSASYSATPNSPTPYSPTSNAPAGAVAVSPSLQPATIPSPFTPYRYSQGASGSPDSVYPSASASPEDTYPSLRRESGSASQAPANQTQSAQKISEETTTSQASSESRAGRRSPRRAEAQPEPHVVYSASSTSPATSPQVSYASTPDPVPAPPMQPTQTPQLEPQPEEIEPPEVNEYNGEPATEAFRPIEQSLAEPQPPIGPAPTPPPPVPSAPVSQFAQTGHGSVVPVSFYTDPTSSGATQTPSRTSISDSAQRPVSKPVPSNVRVRNVAFFRVLRSEWLKFRTLASTWWILAIALAMTIGMGALMGWSVEQIINGQIEDVPPELMTGMTSADIAVQTLSLPQLVLTILGILFITNEFSSGSIRATVMAAPTRTVVIVAKTVILALTTFVVSFVALFAAEELSWYAFTNGLVEDVRTLPDGLKVVAGASLANSLIVLFAFGVGALLRNTAGSIGLVLGVLLVVPLVLQLLPWEWAATAGDYLPSACTTWLYTLTSGASQAAPGPFTYLQALGVSCGWAFGPLLVGLVTFKARDANTSGS